jgi:S-adenosylmethionine:tRNA ribosyltransferase-isomerase
MQLADFDFELPTDLIAQHPLKDRRASRLLTLNKGTNTIAHQQFESLPEYIHPGDLLVFNDTRVIPARLYGQKESGGKLEMLVERVLSEDTVLAHIKTSHALKSGQRFILEGTIKAELIDRQNTLFQVKFHDENSVDKTLKEKGSIPLPPYITRTPNQADIERYQTIYAKQEGAVAAPTAGLHFDKLILDQLQNQGVEFAFLTLHVGAGTFQPVRVESIEDHVIHSEYMKLENSICEQIRETKARGNRVIAVGTTSVRSLETAAKNGEIQPYSGDTRLFIYPGFRFNVVDAMINNFIKQAYAEAIEQRYRFFSYGDAMFIHG